MSAGWTPSVHLFSQSRGKVAFDDATKRFLPGTYAQDCVSVGACNGTDGLAGDDRRSLCGGREGGEGRRRQVPAKSHASRRPTPARAGRGGMLGAAPGAGPDTTVKAFVDFQNDVTAKDIRLAVHEGMRSIEHVKRFTTNGMATDQGKTSNMHGLAIAAETLGKADPGSRPDHLPRALYAGDLRRDRQPRAGSAVRPDPQDGDPSVGRGPRRGVRGCRPMEARLVFPESRRGHARRRRPRMRRRCARPPACSTPRRSARSRWSGRTRRSSWSCSTPIRGRSSSPAAAAMASCCARTVSSMMTASLAGWRPTASM